MPWETYNFTNDFQDAILACLIAHPEDFYDFGEIIKPAYFNGPAASELVFRLLEYKKKFGKYPTFTTLGNFAFHKAARVNIDHAKETLDYVEKLAAIDTGDKDAIISLCIEFAKERAIYDGIRKIHAAQSEGKMKGINPTQIMSDALNVGERQEMSTLYDVLQREPDPGRNLLGNRYFTEGSALIIAGPTGMGKSSIVIQGAVSFAVGLPFLGIKPNGAMRSLIVQAENDDDDIREMALGACRGLHLTEAQQKEALSRITIISESGATGDAFLARLQGWIGRVKPDLVWVDPLLGFMGESVSEQEAVSKFLRKGIDPLIKRAGCGLILVHHTNKPLLGKQKTELQAGDFAYLGAGSAELANYPRAVIGLQPTASPDIFTMLLGKRGRRAGIVDANGKPIFKVHIKQHSEMIFWETATELDLDNLDSAESDLNGILGLIPEDEPISQEALLTTKRKKIGINRFKAVLKLLEERGQLYVWTPKGKKTGPTKSYGKFPMPEDFDWQSIRK